MKIFFVHQYRKIKIWYVCIYKNKLKVDIDMDKGKEISITDKLRETGKLIAKPATSVEDWRTPFRI